MEEETERDTYFQDVRLQMDAKLWGDEYNRHNPPKKICVFMMSVIEMVDRPGRPLFHLEHFIDGDYIKYNSNSGFVENSYCRQTPHAFSHFTFERSGHELIVVDVQGVGDLYTDPQIHTAEGEQSKEKNARFCAAIFFTISPRNLIQEWRRGGNERKAPVSISSLSPSFSHMPRRMGGRGGK